MEHYRLSIPEREFEKACREIEETMGQTRLEQVLSLGKMVDKNLAPGVERSPEWYPGYLLDKWLEEEGYLEAARSLALDLTPMDFAWMLDFVASTHEYGRQFFLNLSFYQMLGPFFYARDALVTHQEASSETTGQMRD